MQRTFGNRVRAAIIGGGASLILATATLAAPALAADQPTNTGQTAHAVIGSHTHQLHGTVKAAVSAGASSFTLTTERYGDVTVSFNAATPNGHGHGRGNAHSHELASLGALTAGERMVVQGRTSADGNTFVARRVHVLPAAEDTSDGASNDATNGTSHLVGVITTSASTSATATTLTIQLADGTSQTIAVSADTRIRPRGKTVADLKVGARVTVVSKNGTATGVVLMPA
jgi:hypothetical protein